MGDSNAGAAAEGVRTGAEKDVNGEGSRVRAGAGAPPAKGRGRVEYRGSPHLRKWSSLKGKGSELPLLSHF